MPLIDDTETLNMFLEESREHLDGIENDLLEIEAAGAAIDPELVNKVFRSVHSIKGGAGFLGLDNIKELAHGMENVMNLIRNQELVPTPEVVSVLLTGADQLLSLINNAEESNEADLSTYLEALKRIVHQDMTPEEQQVEAQEILVRGFHDEELFTVQRGDIERAVRGGQFLYLVMYRLVKDIEARGRTPLDVIREMQQTGTILESKIEVSSVGSLEELQGEFHIPFYVLFGSVLEPDFARELLSVPAEQVRVLDPQELCPVQDGGKEPTEAVTAPSESASETPTKEEKQAVAAPSPANDPAPPKPEPQVAKQPAKPIPSPRKETRKSSSPAPSSLRVNVGLLDRLMTLAGELVLTRNELLQNVNGSSSAVEATAQKVDHITSELQEAIMSTRMQPIGNVFHKFQRVVRDMARNLQKEILLEISGEEVELDKTIIEGIGDPLTHLVRNSVDHGIESPAERQRAGKNPMAKVQLKAFHEAGQVIIEVADDGRGIDPEKIRAKAEQQQLVPPEQLAQMSPRELIKLIFLPGFSTAEKVTDISGRGVGMDVVNTNLTRLGGVVDIESELGKGTTIRIKLPLTLAIIPSLLLEAGGERFAIPQVNLVELVRIPAEQVKERIKRIDDAVMLRLRGELLPLVRLADVLNISHRKVVNPETGEVLEDRRQRLDDRRDGNAAEKPEEDQRRETGRRYHAESAVNVVVVAAGNLHYGLVVDKLLDSEEIVVKPVGRHLKDYSFYAGATILGDGRVAMIMDVMGISRTMGLSAGQGNNSNRGEEEDSRKLTDQQVLLIVRNAAHEQFSVPLSLVARIEKIHREDIEEVSGRKSIRYRGESLPLFQIEEVAQVAPLNEQEQLFVIVFTVGGREVGVLVSSIVDVIETEVHIDDQTYRQPGIFGSAILLDELTLLLDLVGIVTTKVPEWGVQSSLAATAPEEAALILVVDDSRFFLNQIREFVEEAGYRAVTAEDGVQALQVLEENEDVALVLTDIEMPNMDGLEFTRRLRQREQSADLPVIAVTSVAGEAAEQAGKEAGIDDYLVKLDREQILRSVQRLLSEK